MEVNTMTIKRIAAILDAHGVPYLIQDGRIYADTMRADLAPLQETENVTNYSIKKLREFLGY
jgi:hypothetical protein